MAGALKVSEPTEKWHMFQRLRWSCVQNSSQRYVDLYVRPLKIKGIFYNTAGLLMPTWFLRKNCVCCEICGWSVNKLTCSPTNKEHGLTCISYTVYVLEGFNLVDSDCPVTLSVDWATSRPWLYFLQLNEKEFVVDLEAATVSKKSGQSAASQAPPAAEDDFLGEIPRLAQIKSILESRPQENGTAETTSEEEDAPPPPNTNTAPSGIQIKLENGASSRKRPQISEVICLSS